MRISRKLAALAAFFVIAAIIAGCGSSIPSNSVASVAGNPISLQAVNHWMYIAAKQQVASAAQEGESEPLLVANDPPHFTSCIKELRTVIPSLAKTADSKLRTDCRQVFTQGSSEVMAFLIEGYWYQADAHKLGVSITDAQVNKEFAKAKKAEFPTPADFTNYLKTSGYTEQDVLFEIRVNLAYSKLLKRYEKPVNAAAISAYFKAHASEFGTPETRDIHLVRTKTQADAQAALNALKSGQSWNTVAKKYSEDATARKDGGLLSNVPRGQQEAAVSTAIFSSPVNKLIGPIKGLFGYYALEVTKVTAATHESLAKESPTIKSLLNSQEEQKAATKVNDYSTKNWKSKTMCRTTYSVTDCSHYTPPVTTTTPATTSSTPTTASTTGTTTSSTGTTTTG
jgi:parvulin-like peptidyl-prolyl isomerase